MTDHYFDEEIEKLYGPWQVLFTEENILHYRPGGYHPVTLGDMLKDDRYKIVHKLAHDGNSTHWVARDSHRGIYSIIEPYRSLQGHLLSKHIVRLFDDFILDGPNGRHLCLVFELLAPPVDWMVTLPRTCHVAAGGDLDTDTILTISTHLLEALTFLHENGYAHGDISVKTLAYTSDMLSGLDEKELLKVLGAPVIHNVKREDGEPLGEGIPRQIIMAAEWDDYPHDDDDEEDGFCLFDLGGAFTQDTKPEKLAGHECLQAPETLFTSSFDHRADLWSAGLTICYLAVGYLPIHRWPMNALINSSSEYCDGLPKEWQQRQEQVRRDAEEEYGRALRGETESTGSELEVAFRENVKEPQLQVLLPVIKGLTKLSPSNRMSAGQALFLVGMPHEECYATDEGRDVKCY